MASGTQAVTEIGFGSPADLLAARATALLQIETAEAKGNRPLAADARKAVQRIQRLIAQHKIES